MNNKKGIHHKKAVRLIIQCCELFKHSEAHKHTDTINTDQYTSVPKINEQESSRAK